LIAFSASPAREVRQRILAPAAIALGVDDDTRSVVGFLLMMRLMTYCSASSVAPFFPIISPDLRAVRVEDDPVAVIERAHLRFDAHAIQNFPKSFSCFLAFFRGVMPGFSMLVTNLRR
jgi:hypothetical protein